MKIKTIYSIYDASQHGKRIKVYVSKTRAEKFLEQSIYYFIKTSMLMKV